MEEINNQVNAISEAISVIDQIAFQTNILSLNAAVEAATAGEAGRGFAVVAAEVRNLANRSADAAKEIKILVENAKLKANDGKNIADKMILGYNNLNENISKTLNLIKDIESSSKEQLLGIEQINSAINQLDQQTQQNANVAIQTQQIANNTQIIANLIVKNANDKKKADQAQQRIDILEKQYKLNEKKAGVAIGKSVIDTMDKQQAALKKIDARLKEAESAGDTEQIAKLKAARAQAEAYKFNQ